MNFSVDKESNKIQVMREFSAPVSRVWKTWTQPEFLDQWWAPEPWKVQTREMDFREGGKWLYAMIGPEGEKHWSRTDFQMVRTLVGFTALDSFTDEKGNKKSAMPESTWNVEFDESSIESTVVSVHIEFDNDKDLDKILEMGFIEGFSAALQNLDRLLENEEDFRPS